MGPQLDTDLPVVESTRHGAVQARHAIQKAQPQHIAVEEGCHRAPRQTCEDPLQEDAESPSREGSDTCDAVSASNAASQSE